MANDWRSRLGRWVAAGLVDPGTAEAIEQWEAEHGPPLAQPGSVRLGTAVSLALALGGLLLAAGLLLFVAAHWQGLAPSSRLVLLLSLLLAFHGGGALAASSFPALATTLHGIGTVALGGGLYLAAQTFHLEALWPEGMLLWALGAGCGWLLLRQWPQLALLALLAPAWLLAAWQRVCEQVRANSSGLGDGPAVISAAGLLLLSITYLSAPRSSRSIGGPGRQTLLWIGGLALVPTALLWALLTLFMGPTAPLPPGLAACGWSVALGAPLMLAWTLGGQRLKVVGVSAAWMLMGLNLGRWAQSLNTPADLVGQGLMHLWWVLGGLMLALWGSSSARAERVNFGAATIAITVVVYYFTSVYDQLDRALGLLGLGLLFLAGGWALERLRRRLLQPPQR